MTQRRPDVTAGQTTGFGYCFRSHIGLYLQLAIVAFLLIDWMT